MMRNLYGLVLMFLFLLSASVFGAEVTKVKGANALVDLKGTSASPGDLFYTNSADGKHRGIIQISKVKGDKAIAHIAKGKVDVGMSLEPKGASSSASHGGGHKRQGSDSPVGGRSYWGVMGGYAQDSMKVQVNTAGSTTVLDTASLTGSGFSLKGLFDYELFPQIWFRGLGGLESFNVAGAAECGPANLDVCNAKITYLSFDFLGRYVFSDGTFRPWLGGGIALMFPATKSATALASASISNTSVVMITGGADWFISPNLYIPVSIEYGLLPKSNQVDATWIEFRVGFAVPF